MHKFDRFTGEVAEWSIASDLKSDEAKTSGSSNLPLSVEGMLLSSTTPILHLQYIQLDAQTVFD